MMRVLLLLLLLLVLFHTWLFVWYFPKHSISSRKVGWLERYRALCRAIRERSLRP